MINAARRNSRYLLSGNSDFNGVRIDARLYINEGSKNPELIEERSVYAYIAEDGTIQSEKTDIDSVRGDVITKNITIAENAFVQGMCIAIKDTEQFMKDTEDWKNQKAILTKAAFSTGKI